MSDSLTDWFPPGTKPFRTGPYVASGRRDDSSIRYWDGNRWYRCAGNPEGAVANYQAGKEAVVKQESIEWRGLAEQPWIEWRGGECPVPADTPMRIKFRGQASTATYLVEHPQHMRWTHLGETEDGDIVAYRVLP